MIHFLKSIISLTLLGAAATVATGDQRPAEVTVNYTVIEKTPNGTIIGNLVRDVHLARYYLPEDMNQLRFNLFQDTLYGVTMTHVTVEEMTSNLRVKSPIDRDQICSGLERCVLPLGVGISPSNLFLFISVQIEVIDLNDQTPSFPVAVTSLSIPETALPGSAFALPAAFDPDSPSNGVQRYILTGNEDRKFALRAPSTTSGSPTLTVVDLLDREKVPGYRLTLTAVDGGSDPRSASVLVEITVEDFNDNPPAFFQAVYHAHLAENSTAGTWIVAVEATDLDQGDNARIRYAMGSVIPAPGKSLFQVDELSGHVTLARADLDRETVSSYTVTVVAMDTGVPSLSASATVAIAIDDVNDNSPQMTMNTMTNDGGARVSEGANPGTFVALVSATDPDGGENGNVSCAIRMEKEVFQLVRVQTGRYKLVTRTPLDYETETGYDVTVVCSDNGSDRRMENETVLRVEVGDVNDHDPIFGRSLYDVIVVENNPAGAVVARVTATDRDSGENGHVTFDLVAGSDGVKSFFVDPDTGIVSAKVSLDYEKTKSIRVQVRAKDGGTPARYSTTFVQVTVRDANDVAPSFADDSYSFSVSENLPPGHPVGSVSATDPEGGANGIVTYSLPTPNCCFSVDFNTGSITTTRRLDREEQALYKFTVIAGNVVEEEDEEEEGGDPALTSSVHVTVKVDDVNDNPPVIEFPRTGNNSVSVSNSLVPGQIAGRVLAVDADTGLNSRLRFAFETPTDYFTIDTGTGIVYVNSDLSSFQERSFHLVVRATDQGRPPLTSSADLVIVVNASFPAPPPSLPSNGGGALLSSASPNLVVVVCVASVSGLVAILLLAAIFCHAKNQRRRKVTRHEVNLNRPSVTWKNRVPAVAPAAVEIEGGSRGMMRSKTMDAKDASGNVTESGRRLSKRMEMTSISGGEVARTWTRDRDDGESFSSDSGRGPSEEAELNSTTSDHGKGSFERQNGLRLSYLSVCPETLASHASTVYHPTTRTARPMDFRNRRCQKSPGSRPDRTSSSFSSSESLGHASPELSDATSVSSGSYVIDQKNHSIADDVSRWDGQLGLQCEILV